MPNIVQREISSICKQEVMEEVITPVIPADAQDVMFVKPCFAQIVAVNVWVET
jgi:hypothetical protein